MEILKFNSARRVYNIEESTYNYPIRKFVTWQGCHSQIVGHVSLTSEVVYELHVLRIVCSIIVTTNKKFSLRY